MDREQARQQIKTEWRSLITGITQPARKKVNGEISYICPLCDHGKGGDGLARNTRSQDGNGLICFGCGFSGDIIDLYQKVKGVGYNEAFEELAGQIGARIEKGAPVHVAPAQKKPKEEPKEDKGEDLTAFFLKANSKIDKTDYLKRRGISAETAKKFKLGYIEEWKHPKAGKDAPTSPRLIIPITKYNYTARDTRTELTEEQEGYKKQKVKTKENVCWVFNRRILNNSTKPIFIVEGELDAVSITEAGGESVAIGSTAFVRSFIELVKEQKPVQPLILALDQDYNEAGQKAEEELAAELTALQIPFYRVNPYGTAKDANEALIADREAFEIELRKAEHMAEEGQKAAEETEKTEEEAQKAEYLNTCAAEHLKEFMNGIAQNANTPAISTGFESLDEALDGGLYEGLYIIGAISSLGKTTLTLQIMDQLAQNGQDVLIFSLEMARSELIAKSLSRLTCINATDTRHAKSTRGITSGARYQHYNAEEKALINTAVTKYKEYAEHVFIHEGVGDIGVSTVEEEVKKHISFTGNKPVILIDYLQIMAPYDVRSSDKQNTDKAVLELKRLSRKYKIPVIGISSFNRDSYKEGNANKGKVSQADFKESGAIEYSADVLIGLEFARAGGKEYNEREEKQKNPRDIKLVILKNRNGEAWKEVDFKYYPVFNYFKEVAGTFEPVDRKRDPFADLRKTTAN